MEDKFLEEFLDPFRLDGRFFEVICADGMPIEDDIDTVFIFTQVAEIVHADYFGGRIRMGKLLGTVENRVLNFRYLQINRAGEFRSGEGIAQLSLNEDGKLCLSPCWHFDYFESAEGCILRQMEFSRAK